MLSGADGTIRPPDVKQSPQRPAACRVLIGRAPWVPIAAKQFVARGGWVGPLCCDRAVWVT